MGVVWGRRPGRCVEVRLSSALTRLWADSLPHILTDLSITALMFWYLVFKPKRESGGMVKASSCVSPADTTSLFGY